MTRPIRVLVVAPHPFYEDRGTPIDVLLVLRVLTERPDVEVELLTYHIGEDVDLPGLTIHRIRCPGWIRDVRPGFSLKKLLCDTFLFFRFVELLRRRGYDFVHAGEEAAVLGLYARRRFGIPYAFDLDSSIAQQLMESRPIFRVLSSVLTRVEARLMRESLIAFPSCRLLAELCVSAGAGKVVTLFDVSQLTEPGRARTGTLRDELGVADDEILVLYVGNLEAYQGVDLLVDAFAIAAQSDARLRLAIVGGTPPHVRKCRKRIARLGLSDVAGAVGPRRSEHLDAYLADADILACPRTLGLNTPLKVFPYLHSGRPVLATRLPTHTQILTDREAKLGDATPEAFARALLELASSPEERERLSRAGRELVERDHTYEAHRNRLNAAYDWVRERLEDVSSGDGGDGLAP